MKFNLLILFSIALIGIASAFFSFVTKKKDDDIVSPPSPFPINIASDLRGLPLKLAGSYQDTSKFTCRDGSKVISRAEVNDDFCDCYDGSDEPGTSACLTATFYCINNGYRMVQIPSSRVDDGICDCCDGSDESRVITCPNVCNAAAEKERAMLQKLVAVYETGGAIRVAEEARITAELNEHSSKVGFLTDLHNQLTDEVDSLRTRRYAEKENLDAKYSAYNEKVVADISCLLELDEIIAGQHLPTFLLNLMSLSSIVNEDHIKDIIKSLSDEVSSSDLDTEASNDENSEPSATPDEDPYHDHSHDDIESPTESEIENVESEEGGLNFADSFRTMTEEIDIDTTVTGDASTVSPVASNCEWTFGVKNLLLNRICDTNPSLDFAKQFLMLGLIKSKTPYREIQNMIGFYHAFHTFENTVAFVGEYISTNIEDKLGCHSDFQDDSKNACGLAIELDLLYQKFSFTFDTFDLDARQPYEALEQEFFAAQTNRDDALSKKNSADAAATDLIKHASHLALLSHRNTCFTAESGNYKYSFCSFDKVSQSELHGSGEVTLGEYSDVYENEDGSYTMKFTDGQYCHAFGPRTADVTITCGRENVLLGAREPSTCFYQLEFESPAACTVKFAQVAGLV